MKGVIRIRLDKIELSWFRGASDSASLDLSSKNVVVYGPTASGKSSFVDALEYIIENGKIRHLTHEYSGRRLERSVRNTHTPSTAMSSCSAHFDDGSYIVAQIEPDGTHTITCNQADIATRVHAWSLENHVLRQDEVSDFIEKTKGAKYSVLLPLLGLGSLEYAAENLKELAHCVTDKSKIEMVKAKIRELTAKANKHFPSIECQDVLDRLCELYRKYVGEPPLRDVKAIAIMLEQEIERRIDRLKPEYDRYILLSQMSQEDLDVKLKDMISARERASSVVQTILDCRIAVLESTSRFTNELKNLDEDVECPSCGQMIRAADLVDHVKGEIQNQKEARSLRDAAETARDNFTAAFEQVLGKVKHPAVTSWLGLPDQREINDAITELSSIRPTRRGEYWAEDDLKTFNDNVPKLTQLLSKEIAKATPSTKELIEDQEAANVGRMVPGIHSLRRHVMRIETLITAMENGERLVRDEIRARTEETIKRISAEIQRLWSKVHPGEGIEGVQLYMPSEPDKAIDIGLKFYGVDQASPRLTLSEGQRNCLGLCIFLALTRLRAETDHPIVLDDIVSSLDRGHRGMLVDLITEDLADRQVIVLTHDREWYTELRARLPSAQWEFMVLRPWENPSIGIQWSRRAYTLDEARTLIASNAEAGGNRARAMMDVELAIAAERLKVSMPYLRGDANDRRTCVDFLNRIIGEAPKRLKKKEGDEWRPYADPIRDWEETKGLIIAWGDPASHGGMLTAGEAEKLIEACEKALGRFRCRSCGDPIWLADQTGRELVQCTCGELRWSYGK